ncbi:bifunctional hydroxymethylpyrimidine kinase/phosphomethylpyrimidine kinase [Alicyclobacillus vulcanalis]|uniref:Hydroxymethylpyrimidine/phosphomethylpyrimidine kinase n=1 Tax=Alicyclobacillus vulcanalis TaxID=252246 RepID=A0A1N7KVT6_9BACL|nr:bifunctional hydroxymethylpyrimidine kinase/phosphomethylpyrimidine kinase [Alicyclobacillus vulcanalis]SIS65752.1 hydroxymethylpyrimidine/phosphomethylpyrimidine kinase [Alicyclobacillus vulcanalis]
MFRYPDGHVARMLTIAGSDSGGGAGIQADLKTAHQFDVYGMSVLTAVTAQNTVGVQAVHPLPVDIVRAQLKSIQDDLGFDAVKTGMLGDRASILAIAAEMEGVTCPVVVDPVMVAKGGEALLAPEDVAAVIERMLPVAFVATPNAPEAERLTGIPIRSLEDAARAAEALHRRGARYAVVKGGHLEGLGDLAVDVVYDGASFTYFAAPRVPSRKTHGTGCTFSSAIAAALARGAGALEAIAAAKSYIARAIASAADWDVGRGHGPTDHSVSPVWLMRAQPGRMYVFDGRQFVETAPPL